MLLLNNMSGIQSCSRHVSTRLHEQEVVLFNTGVNTNKTVSIPPFAQ